MPNILVVDDDHDVVSLIKFLLEKDGCQVVEAFNGTQALEAIGLAADGVRQNPGTKFDLIILDVMMPGMDGYSVSSKLLADAETRSIPIIILTAKGSLHDLFAQASNVSACLAKPFDPKKLRQMVSDILSPKQ